MEVFWESDRYVAPEHLKPSLRNQPQRYTARGAAVKRLDHVNLLARDVAACRRFATDVLGYRHYEGIVLDNGRETGAWMSLTIAAHELIYVEDARQAGERLHHLAFWVDTREECLRAADIFLDHGVHIEAAPSRHAVAAGFFLYSFEPGGNRIEVTTGGYLVYEPDPEPVLWTEAERARGQAWGVKTVESFHYYGTPPAPEDRAYAAGRGRRRALAEAALGELPCARSRGVGGLVVDLLLGVALRGHALAVDLDLARDLRLGPAEHLAHQPRRRLGGDQAAVERLDRDAGAPGEHVVEVEGALVRRGVPDLDAQVVLGAAERLAELRARGRPRRAARRCGSRSAAADARCARGAARSRPPGAGARSTAPGSPRRRRAASRGSRSAGPRRRARAPPRRPRRAPSPGRSCTCRRRR